MKILLAVDLADSQHRLIAETIRTASAFNAKVCLLHVTEVQASLVGYEAFYDEGFANFPDPKLIRDGMADRFRREHAELHAISQTLQAGGVSCFGILVHASLNAVDTILEQAEKHEVDLIILGTHNKGVFTRLLVGSTSTGVLQKTRTPVLVVPIGPEAG